MIAFWGLAIVLAVGLAPLAGAAPDVPAPPAVGPADSSDQEAAASEPVTLISLTDAEGDRTPIAVDGLHHLEGEAEQQDRIAPAGHLAGAAPAPAVPRPERPAPREETATPSEDELGDVAILTPPVPTQEFLVAGLSWEPGQELPAGSEIFLRVYERGEWSEWSHLGSDGAGPEDEAGRGGTDPFVTGGARAVQLQVSGDAEQLPAGLDLSLIPANPKPAEAAITEPPTAPAPEPTADPIAPPEVERDEEVGGAQAPAPPGEAATDIPSPLVQDARSHVEPAEGAPARFATYSPPEEAGLRFELAALRADSPVTPAPDVISRTEWGADEAMMTWEPTSAPLQAAVVHHTAGTNSYGAAQSAAIVRGIYHFHAVTRDWGDIGYNYLVDRYGQVFEGRSGTLETADTRMPQGAHARGYNYGSLGISAMGDFTRAGAPQVVLERMADVIAWRFSLAEIDAGTMSSFVSPQGATYRGEGERLPRIFAHGDVAATSCPAPDIYGRMDSIRRGVTARIDAAEVRWHSPVGAFDSVRGVPGGAEISGWTIDPDTDDPIYVWVTVDGVGRHVLADRPRPDVAAEDPSYGSAHGFRTRLPASAGRHVVCVTASNGGQGAHVLLGCRAVDVPGGSPFGTVDEVIAVPGGLELRGWAIDPDTTDPVYVWVTVDGVGRHLVANRARSDVGASFPDYGAGHGYSGRIEAGPGVRRVCATAANVGAGAHAGLGCRDVAVLAGSPMGNLENVRAVPSGIEISGWAIDPDTRSPIYAWVTIDGAGRHVLADRNRGDVGRAFPGYGPGHGFGWTTSVVRGTHQVCVGAANVLSGSHTSLGCRDVRVG